MLIMQKNCIFKKSFDSAEKHLCAQGEPVFKQFPDVLQKVDKTFLLGESSDFAKVSAPKVSNEYIVVKLSEMINNNLGTTTFVDMEESDVRISENPKPVSLPASLINMNELGIRQRLFQRFVQRLALFGNMVIKANQCSRRQAQAAKAQQSQSCSILRGFDLVSYERYFCFDVRFDESVGNFILSPAVYGFFTVSTPVIKVYKTRRGKLAVLKVFMNMFGCMIAWRNILTSAKRTKVKVNINGFIDLRGIATEPTRMADRSAAFLRIFGRFFLFALFEQSQEHFGKFIFKIGFIIFKFLDASLKLHGLPVGNVHGKFKFINSAAKVFPFRQNSVRGFAVEKYAEISKRAMGTFNMLPAIGGLSVLPGHFEYQLIKKLNQKTKKYVRLIKSNVTNKYFYDSVHRYIVNSN